MNNKAKGLLEKHFDLAFSAPNGVQKLRALILTFAMQGKLVPQDPSDQPASELLKAIEAEKQRLVKEGKIKQPKSLPEIKLDEVPHTIPENWEWVRIRNICYDWGQKTPDKLFTYIDVGSIDNKRGVICKDIQLLESFEAPSRARKIVHQGTIIYSTVRPYLLNIAIIDKEFPHETIASTAFAILHPFCEISNRFIYYYLRSPVFIDYVESIMKGVAYPAINDGDFFQGLFPLPPLVEQHRIVAKIDRLMAQCDELENLGGDRNQKRITIHTAAIDRLLAAQADSDFSTAWDFIQQHFGELYSVKENVAELRKAILQLAVMGKLVPQDPNDEPASELLKAISASKNRLVLQGKVKEPKSLPEIRSEEIQYQLPEKWEWVRLGKITNIVRGGSPRPAGDPEFYDGDIPFLKVADLTATDEMYLKTSTYSIKEAGLRKTRLVPPDTLMLTNSGATLGIPKICTFETTFNDGIAAFIYMDKNLDKPFFYYVLSSRTQWFLDVASRGQGQPNLNTDIIGETPVALPPLAEQRRIVTKIGQLMTLCNELEQQIDAATDKRTELLKALMAQV
jgi:type I restriction enzyme, S subunit